MKKSIFTGILGLVLIFSGCQKVSEGDIVSKNVKEEVQNNIYENINSQEKYINIVNQYKVEPIYYFEDNYESLFDELTEYYNNQKGIDFDSESFKEEFFVDASTIIYDVDINNDGDKEIVFASLGRGTGHFSGIDYIFKIVEENDVKKLQVIEPPNMIFGESASANYIDILAINDDILIKLSGFDNIDTMYIWKEDVKIVFSENDFVNNDHLDESDLNEDQRIKTKYDIESALKELEKNNIDYSVSGYSNEEVLLSYYKINDYIINGDKEMLSRMIVYPLVYYPEGNYQLMKIYTKEEFVGKYDEIVSDNLKTIVESSKYNELFSNWKGNMIGDGQIWFGKYILTINDF